MSPSLADGPACPVPGSSHRTVQMAHGGGGRMTLDLIERLFVPAFGDSALAELGDGAVLDLDGTRLAFTTDSYVVKPVFFPGGSIGTLAAHGTVNDLSMCGARPVALSVGMILEEGFPLADLERVVDDLRAAAAQSGVRVVTGDTKVVDRGRGDGIYLNTAGIGVLLTDDPPRPARMRPGDAVILSGDIGRHGTAIMAAREGLEFESDLVSDCASLAAPVQALFAAGVEVHSLRDLTRGGLATALIEMARQAGVGIRLRQRDIPLDDAVRGVCEILGLDPAYVANEGRMVVIVPEAACEQALDILRAHEVTATAVRIGEITPGPPGRAILESELGTERILDLLSGEQLPRIC